VRMVERRRSLAHFPARYLQHRAPDLQGSRQFQPYRWAFRTRWPYVPFESALGAAPPPTGSTEFAAGSPRKTAPRARWLTSGSRWKDQSEPVRIPTLTPSNPACLSTFDAHVCDLPCRSDIHEMAECRVTARTVSATGRLYLRQPRYVLARQRLALCSSRSLAVERGVTSAMLAPAGYSAPGCPPRPRANWSGIEFQERRTRPFRTRRQSHPYPHADSPLNGLASVVERVARLTS